MDSEFLSLVNSLLEKARTPDNLKDARLRTAVVREISSQLFLDVQDQDKGSIFECCEQLLGACEHDARTIAFDWAYRCRNDYHVKDFDRFERWLMQYVDGWASCDDFCTHAFGCLVYGHPECAPKVKTWSQSENRWMRRAAAVVLIYAVRRDALHKEAFEIADLLLIDRDDMVQKGYGWLLKEVSNRDPQPVFEYVMSRKRSMPRTALRYAIEKLDPDLRQRAMAR